MASCNRRFQASRQGGAWLARQTAGEVTLETRTYACLQLPKVEGQLRERRREEAVVPVKRLRPGKEQDGAFLSGLTCYTR